MRNPLTAAKNRVENVVKSNVQGKIQAHLDEHKNTYKIAAGALSAGVVGTLLLRGASTTVNVHVHINQEES
jgi:hypothetical protein